MRLVNWRSLAIAAAGFGLAACGDDVTVTPPPISFTVNPSAVSCVAGQATAVGLTVSGGAGTPSVAFTPGSTTIVTAGTASGNTYTFTCGAVGASAINFVITSGGQTVSGSIPVTVTAAPPAPSSVTAVVVSPATATVVPGGTVQLTAQVTLAPTAPASTSTAVTWTTSDATAATVDANGKVTALANAAGKTAVITATSVANTNIKASSALTVGPASSLVQGLAVSPGAVTLSSGQTQQITSNVTLAAGAPAGTPTGVTYISSDTSIAKVSTAGLITAGSKPGVATITVASVAAPTVTQTIGVTVQALAPVRLTIQGLQVVNGAGNLVPADPTNVAGNLFATLNLDPGSFTPDSVVATLGTQRIVCQRFSAQLAQALKSSLTDGAADFAPIQCAINTSTFNNTTGVAAVQNGAQQFAATVFYRPVGGTAAQQQTASITQNLTLNNASGFFASVTNAPSAAQLAAGGPASGQATGPQNVLWRAGSITVTVLPVNFGAAPVGTGNTTLTVNLADANVGQVASKQVSGSPTGPLSVTFSGTTAAYTAAPANQTLDGYSSPGAGTPTGGTTIQIGGAANTVFLNASGVPQAGGPVVWIDNASPEPRAQFIAPAFILNSGAGTSGFLNGTFDFSTSIQQNAAVTTLADNNGVDRVTRSFFFANASAGLTAAEIVAANQSATNASGAIAIPANTTPGQYVAAVNLVDALGNALPLNVGASGAPAAATFTFGVSTAAPTLTLGGTGANNGRYGATTTTARTVTGTFSSPVGFARNPALISVTRVSPSGTFCAAAPVDIVDGSAGNVADIIQTATTPASGACAPIGAGSVSINPTTAQEGIYTVTFQTRDVAGNTSAVLTRTFVIDRTAPTATNARFAPQTLRGGQPATFSVDATDNINLVAGLSVIGYQTGGSGLNLRYDGNALGTAFAQPFVRTGTVTTTVPALIRAVALQPANTGANSVAFVQIGQVDVGATDAGNNAAYATISGAAIGQFLDQTQPAPALFGGSGAQYIDIRYTPNNTTTSSTTAPANLYGGAGTTTTPSAVTINMSIVGLANTPFTSPFSRVELYERSTTPGSPTAVSYKLLGTFSQGGVSVSPTSATIANTFTYTPTFPSTSTGPIPSDLLVVATDANGYAVAFIIPTITLNP